jgi:hypothetical protein
MAALLTIFGFILTCALVSAIITGFLKLNQVFDDAFNGLGNVNGSNHDGSDTSE